MTQRPDMKLLSPTQWPPQPGTLAITLGQPRGYVVHIHTITGPLALVTYLDDVESFTLPLTDLIPTGKTPDDLCTPYDLTPIEWDNAVDTELSFPTWTPTKKSRTSPGGGAKGGVKRPKTSLDKLKKMTKDDQQKLVQALLTMFKK